MARLSRRELSDYNWAALQIHRCLLNLRWRAGFSMAGRSTSEHSILVRFKLFASDKLSRMRRVAVGRGAKAILLDTENGSLLVEVEDMGVGRVLSQQGSYGLDEIQRLGEYISPESDVLVV